MADYWPWQDWFKSFVVDGKRTEKDEKEGILSFLGPDHSEILASISFTHMGILSLEPEAVDASPEETARFSVELYCEEMFFDTLNAGK